MLKAFKRDGVNSDALQLCRSPYSPYDGQEVRRRNLGDFIQHEGVLNCSLQVPLSIDYNCINCQQFLFYKGAVKSTKINLE